MSRIKDDQPEMFVSLSEIKNEIKAKMKRLEILIGSKEREISILQSELKMATEASLRQKKQIEDHFEKTKMFLQKSEELENEVNVKNSLLESLNKEHGQEINNLQDKMTVLEKQINELKGSLDSRNREINALVNQNKQETAKFQKKIHEETEKLNLEKEKNEKDFIDEKKEKEKAILEEIGNIEAIFKKERQYWKEKINQDGSPAVEDNRQAQIRVHFTYKNREAAEVKIAGNFNTWVPEKMNRDDKGAWETTLELSPGEYHYKFVVDGKWIKDPFISKTVRDNYGGESSVIDVI